MMLNICKSELGKLSQCIIAAFREMCQYCDDTTVKNMKNLICLFHAHEKQKYKNTALKSYLQGSWYIF